MAKDTSKRRVPPSRVRYEQSHPTIAIRVPKELYDRLVEIRQKTGQSWADLMKVALKLQQPVLQPRQLNEEEVERALEIGREGGFEEGWEAAREEYLVSYACRRCGGLIELHSPEEKRSAAQLMTEHGWAHRQCP